MDFKLIINIIGLIALIFVLYKMQKKHLSFTKRVFTALGLGIVYGLILHYVYGPNSDTISVTKDWFNIIGSGYVRLLQMIVMPLIMVSITSAIINLKDSKQLGKMGGNIIAILLITAAIAGLVGIMVSLFYKLDATGMLQGSAEMTRAEYLQNKLGEANSSFPQKVLDFIPTNPFLDMTGARNTSTIAVVIFSAFVGIAALGIQKKKPESLETFRNIVNSAHDIVMRMVTLVLRLTPYGILALITNVLASSDFLQIAKLIKFILASYTAIIIMFIIHMIILALFKLNPVIYLKKVFPVLTFAFTSRTSMGAIPLNIETQTKKLGVSQGIANLSATFGASIGQNGCAAIYPAMLAVMIAPTVGVNPYSIGFIAKLIVIITISSFGVAGVGGGATFAALIVLSSLGFPVGLAGLLISVEPLIDMGRTALNVNDSILSGVVTGKMLNELNTDMYNDPALISVESDEMHS
ncbi:Transporter of cystine tcyP [Sebaldella termitidis]|jgi:L-cystine uptake protein TcyP (sodium:dicarboxylate symporter family)|uniref:Sodium:dicarboxylate symporter n=1 Tax=Sebaldella termitidis (strain ATCC 33386 / NCTC 11300) TaxID=526218 RepID=D1APX6_SEBTE|nr:L-cystine transporter [Sebaldella termitidis]ACZ07554.1 sodium:dicarboxylate symporter [Sebaldella termitidis ATCC 33386]SUI22850.1 Transporter of cystine tcyP [Sebaldella termitidis]